MPELVKAMKPMGGWIAAPRETDGLTDFHGVLHWVNGHAVTYAKKETIRKHHSSQIDAPNIFSLIGNKRSSFIFPRRRPHLPRG